MTADESPFAMAQIYLRGSVERPPEEAPSTPEPAPIIDSTKLEAELAPIVPPPPAVQEGASPACGEPVLTCRYYVDGSLSFQFGDEVRVLTAAEVASFKQWMASHPPATAALGLQAAND